MAATVKTYLVISTTPVVVENPVFAAATSYQPGDTFEELNNNASINRLLEDELITEVAGADPTQGFVVVAGDPGPSGPTGPAGTGNLAIVLAAGNVTGGSDILLTGGDKVMGGRACFGDSSAALVDGDLSAGAGVRELIWDSATADFSVSDGTRTLGYTGATGQLQISGIDGAVQAIVVGANADGLVEGAISNASAGASAAAGWRISADVAEVQIVANSSGAAAANEVDIVSTGGTLSLGTSDANSVLLRTQGLGRWEVTSAGHLAPTANDTYDIGIAGTNRVRDIVVGNSIRIGGVLGLAAAGDLRAGNGVNELFWDASEGTLTIPTLVADSINPAESTVLMQQVFS